MARFDPFGRAKIAAVESELVKMRQDATELQAGAAKLALQAEEASAMQDEYKFLRETQAFYSGATGDGAGVVSEERRQQDVQRSRRHFVEDALIQRAVLTYFSFVFGRGVSNPRIAGDYEDSLLADAGSDLPAGTIERRRWKRQNMDKLPVIVQQLQKTISAFWNDPVNRRQLTGYPAQQAAYTAFKRDGELPLLLFPAGSGGNARFGCALLDSLELTQTVEHPEKPGVVLWMLRKYRVSIEGSTQLRETASWYPTVDAYFDPEAAEKTNPKQRPIVEVGQAEVKGDAYIYLFKTSFAAQGLRGHPAFWAALKWSGATVDTVSNLRTWLRARATWAWNLLRPGGASKVAATASKLETKQDGTQPAPPVASVFVRGNGVELEGLDIGSSGAAAFKIAIDTLMNMVCAATGIPKHYFGDVSAGKLTTADSVELEVLKIMQGEQALWTAFYDDLFQTMARLAGLDVDTQRLIEIDFPNIDAKDAATLLPALAQAAMGGIAPQAYAARYAALVLGEDDVEGWVEAVMGESESQEPPESMTQLMQMVEDNPLAAAPVVLRLTQRVKQKLALETTE